MARLKGRAPRKTFSMICLRRRADDQAKMETLKQIIEKVLEEQSNDCVRTEWNKWKDVYLLSHAMRAYKMFTKKENFENQLIWSFGTIFADDEQLLAKFAAGVYSECVRARLIVESQEFSTRVVTVTHGLDQDFLGTFDLNAFQAYIHKVSTGTRKAKRRTSAHPLP